MLKVPTEPPTDALTIIRAIEEAFGGVRRGNGVTLHEADAMDDGATGETLIRARAKDSERRWQDVSPEAMERMYSALAFLDAEGFRFYIPAYMTWTLGNYANSGSMTVDNTIYSLWPNARGSEARYAMLTAAQKRCIAQFLWFMAAQAGEQHVDAYAATRALEDTWYSHLESDG